jgi:galactonate dehydratase
MLQRPPGIREAVVLSRGRHMSIERSRRSFLKQAGAGGAAGMLVAFGSGIQHAVAAQSVASKPSDLKITRISTAFATRSQRRMFVKVETNQGITGYGEGTDAVVGGHYLASVFGSQLIGKNPLDVNRLFEDVRRVNQDNVFSGAQGGMFISVLSGFEIALWDLAGKALEVPVYRLLGGKFRDSIHLYTHPRSNGGTPEQIAASCLEARDIGFDAIKFWVDRPADPNKQDVYNTTANPKEIERIVKTVAAVRSAVGDYTEIMVEMHTRFDLPTAIRLIREFEPFKPLFVEEPVPAENMDALREVTVSSNIPICVGENLFLAHQFQTLLDKKAADIIMPDIQKCGGIGEGQRIANLAHLHYVPIAPHMVSSPLGMMASAHLCASVPNFLMLESNQSTQYEGVVSPPPIIENGFLRLSDRPGIGVDLNEDGLRRIATPGIPFFE